MKVIKLIIIFIVVVGVIVGIFYLVSGFKPGGPFNHGPSENYSEELLKKINDSWNEKDDWDENLYERLWNDCRQIQSIENINTESHIRRNTTLALEKINEKIFAQWGKSNCSRSEVRKYKNAIDFIEGKDPVAKNAPEVQSIKRVYMVYNKAYNFSHRDDIKYSPVYNGDSNSWNSFADYQRKIENERDAIKNNADYNQYLSNIEDLKTGLSTRIEGKLAIAKDRFYEMLAEEIIYFYKDRERDESERDTLLKARRKYMDEYKNNKEGFFIEFSTFVNEFVNEVDEKKKEETLKAANQTES